MLGERPAPTTPIGLRNARPAALPSMLRPPTRRGVSVFALGFQLGEQEPQFLDAWSGPVGFRVDRLAYQRGEVANIFVGQVGRVHRWDG